MKKSSMLLFVAALVLSSCGTATQFASSDNEQKFQDGIYNSSPSFKSKTEKAEDQAVTDALIEKTKASEIYLLGEKKDTIMIPDNFSARIQYDQKLGGTVITVGENPYDWRFDLENNYGYYYDPYSIGASWYWSRHYNPWYWNTWSYSPWRYNSWYYNSWYDPWYYGGAWGFYDPWYYGGWYGGWNPYYPYYAGWYGGIGWYPHHHHHHHHHHPGHIHNPGGPSKKNHFRGQRYQTGSERLAAGGGSSLRGGSSVRSSVSRSTPTAATLPSTGRGTSGATVSRTTTNRTSATKVNNTTNSTSKGSAVKPATGSNVTRTAPPGYRKPTATQESQSQNSGQTYRSSTTQTRSSSSQTRSSSTPSRSQESSSYQRSSSPSYNRSSAPSSSGGGFSRSSSSGGSVSRGGSSSTYRR